RLRARFHDHDRAIGAMYRINEPWPPGRLRMAGVNQRRTSPWVSKNCCAICWPPTPRPPAARPCNPSRNLSALPAVLVGTVAIRPSPSLRVPHAPLDGYPAPADRAGARLSQALPRTGRPVRLRLRTGQLPAGRPSGRPGQGDRRGDAGQLAVAGAGALPAQLAGAALRPAPAAAAA